MVLRPHGLFYEPSYAGAALAFATLVLLGTGWPRPSRLSLAAAVTATTAVVLTSSRTGYLSLLFGAGVAVAIALVQRRTDALRRLGLVFGLATLVLAAFFATPGGARYGRFMAGPMGPAGILQRLGLLKWEDGSVREVAGSSEADRVEDLKAALRRVRAHPLLGTGVQAGAGDRVLKPLTTNTWAEVAAEWGVPAFLALLAALVLTLRTSLLHTDDPRRRLFVVAAVAAHLLVDLAFTQTLPRLDYWLLVFAALRTTMPAPQREAVPRASACSA
jgi:O-antigen ligase